MTCLRSRSIARPRAWPPATRWTSSSRTSQPRRSADPADISEASLAQGGTGVAACWYGGARGVARTLLAAAVERDIGPHAEAHLGAVDIAMDSALSALDAAAAGIDADPADSQVAADCGPFRRALVEAVATEVMHRVGRALGAGPLSHDESHFRRVADLAVYLRQHHAERDLAQLGELVASSSPTWSGRDIVGSRPTVSTGQVPPGSLGRIGRPKHLPAADPPDSPSVMIVAPSRRRGPGTRRRDGDAAAAGTRLRLITVTDGEASHPRPILRSSASARPTTGPHARCSALATPTWSGCASLTPAWPPARTS